jgi:hypothetical protein
MFKRSNVRAATLLFLLGVVTLAGVLAASSAFRDCYVTAGLNKSEGNRQSTLATILDRPWRVASCEAVSLNKYNGTVSATATLAIAAFTLVMWRATRAQTDISAGLAKLADREFVATHRPKLILREAYSLISDPLESKIAVFYTITNVGGSECWMTGVYKVDVPNSGMVRANRVTGRSF